MQTPNIANMVSHSRRRMLIAVGVAAVTLLSLPWLWPMFSVVHGRLDATLDVRRGHYQRLVYGLPVPWRPRYAQCLKERYDVEMRPVAGCIVSSSLEAYVRGYDSVMDKAIERKFGHSIYSECVSEAESQWKAASATAN